MANVIKFSSAVVFSAQKWLSTQNKWLTRMTSCPFSLRQCKYEFIFGLFVREKAADNAKIDVFE
ncbi:hypothetical protein BZG01_21165 [Labilibaculum manganireducens]|uniref:Uncharacterized protein n=1 Tax=Labilibaculum manganireducens TaxID=1940525 RepID=A0A2N3HQA2_9BACT|nr:hypothetical protein BZG01_21165 [Labilibaculum manganireducens]